MIKSFEVIPQNSRAATYENRNYGILIKYPSDRSKQESTASGTPINVATFVSPTGPNFNPTADISIYLDKLHNSTTTLNNYAHFVAFTDYENKPVNVSVQCWICVEVSFPSLSQLTALTYPYFCNS